MKTIKFSRNWNNKLDACYFTTIRLVHKFTAGETVEILLDKKTKCLAKVVEHKVIQFIDISDWMWMLDTGMNPDKAKAYIRSVYKEYVPDWNAQRMSVLLLERVG
jgi:hypothetical protein